jgi:hypothetical protein
MAWRLLLLASLLLLFFSLDAQRLSPFSGGQPAGSLSYAELQAKGQCMGGSTLASAQTCIVPGNSTLLLSNIRLEVRLTLQGEPGARLKLSNKKDNAVKTSSRLTISNLNLQSMNFVSTDIFNSSSALQLAGVVLDQRTSASQLVLVDSTIALTDCNDWSSLASNICSLPQNTPLALGNTTVTASSITISFFQSSTVTWSNVGNINSTRSCLH